MSQLVKRVAAQFLAAEPDDDSESEEVGLPEPEPPSDLTKAFMDEFNANGIKIEGEDGEIHSVKIVPETGYYQGDTSIDVGTEPSELLGTLALKFDPPLPKGMSPFDDYSHFHGDGLVLLNGIWDMRSGAFHWIPSELGPEKSSVMEVLGETLLGPIRSAFMSVSGE